MAYTAVLPRRNARRARAGRSCPSRRAGRVASRPGRRYASWAGAASPSWSTAAARSPARFAERLAAIDGVEVGNDVVLNQVLVRLRRDDAATDAVIDAVQRDGTCWMGGTTWQGRRYMRISVSNWSTTEADVDRSVDAIYSVLRASRS